MNASTTANPIRTEPAYAGPERVGPRPSDESTIESLERIIRILGVEIDSPGKGRLHVAMREACDAVARIRGQLEEF